MPSAVLIPRLRLDAIQPTVAQSAPKVMATPKSLEAWLQGVQREEVLKMEAEDMRSQLRDALTARSAQSSCQATPIVPDDGRPPPREADDDFVVVDDAIPSSQAGGLWGVAGRLKLLQEECSTLLSQRLAFPDLFGQRSHSPAKAPAVTAADSPGPAAVPFTPSRPGPWLTARTQPRDPDLLLPLDPLPAPTPPALLSPQVRGLRRLGSRRQSPSLMFRRDANFTRATPESFLSRQSLSPEAQTPRPPLSPPARDASGSSCSSSSSCLSPKSALKAPYRPCTSRTVRWSLLPPAVLAALRLIEEAEMAERMQLILQHQCLSLELAALCGARPAKVPRGGNSGGMTSRSPTRKPVAAPCLPATRPMSARPAPSGPTSARSRSQPLSLASDPTAAIRRFLRL
eukprot:EG_transcript_6052